MSRAAARGHTGRGPSDIYTTARAPLSRPAVDAPGGRPVRFSVIRAVVRSARAHLVRFVAGPSVRVVSRLRPRFSRVGTRPTARVHASPRTRYQRAPGLVCWKGGGKCSMVRVRAPVRDTRHRARDVTPP